MACELAHPPARLTLFGSRARGDADPESDMDVLVEIDADELSSTDKQRLQRIATEVSVVSGIVVCMMVVDRQQLRERGDYSILKNIRAEGIAV